MLMLPDDWKYSIGGLAAICKESKNGIRTAVRELETYGYVEREQERKQDGRMGDIEYRIYENPKSLVANTGMTCAGKTCAGFTGIHFMAGGDCEATK